MGEQMKLPPGFRFNPKDEEIISWYLKPKFLGQTLVCDFIDTAELYGSDSTPWLMFDVNSWMDSQNNTEKYMYVFAKLSKLRASDSNKKMSSRDNTSKKAGCGTWAGKTNRKIRDGKDNVIGEKRLMVFEINDIGAGFDVDKAAYFKMHEYSLSGINKGLKAAPGVGDLVLCKLTYDSSKQPVFKMASKSVAHDPNQSDECQNKNGNLEGSVGVEENLEVAGNSTSESVVERNSTSESVVERNSTSESVVEMTNGVGNKIESGESSTSENVFEMHNGFCDFDDFDDYLAANDQYNNDFLDSNEFVGDPGFDINWLNDLLSNQEDEQVEDNHHLGKRKFEEENLHGTKKMCF